MAWERIGRKSSGSNRGSIFAMSASVIPQGIRLTGKAKDEFIGNHEFVELYVDREAHKIAFKPLARASFNSFKVCEYGHSGSFISCRSVITEMRIKGQFLLRRAGELIELVPIPEQS